MSSTGLHISISAEPIFYLGDLAITNSMLTGVVVSAIIITFAFVANRSLKDTSKPAALQNFAEWIVESLFGLVNSISSDKQRANVFFPMIASFFIFIILNNWFGLLPGVGTIMVPLATRQSLGSEQLVDTTETNLSNLERTSNDLVEEDMPNSVANETKVNTELVAENNLVAEDVVEPHEEAVTIVGAEAGEETAEVHEDTESHLVLEAPLFRPATADLNTTLALGIITIFVTQFYGFYFLKFGYLSKFFDFSSPIMFIVGILELVSEFSKIISFAFRLFGNIFAGEVLLVVITYLTKVIVPVPFYGLEVFVGFIQALVFAMLSVVFFNMATQSHEEH